MKEKTDQLMTSANKDVRLSRHFCIAAEVFSFITAPWKIRWLLFGFPVTNSSGSIFLLSSRTAETRAHSCWPNSNSSCLYSRLPSVWATSILEDNLCVYALPNQLVRKQLAFSYQKNNLDFDNQSKSNNFGALTDTRHPFNSKSRGFLGIGSCSIKIQYSTNDIKHLASFMEL